MDQFKKLGELARQHYEKVILTLALFGLAGAVYYLYLQNQAQQEKIEEYFRTKVQQKVKAVTLYELAPVEAALSKIEKPPELNLRTPHHLLNALKWQRRPDGSIVKIQNEAEIGPLALSVAAVRPLHMTIALDRPAGEGFWMTVTNESFSRGRPEYRVSQYVSLANTNSRVFILREVQPADNPAKTNWVVELRDSGAKVSVTKEQPFRMVVGYEVDLRYEVEGKSFNQARVGTKLKLSGEDYNIVAITDKEILLSAVSNDRRFTIRNPAVP